MISSDYRDGGPSNRGDESNTSSQLLSRKGAKVRRQDISKRNMLPIPNTARASLRYELSSTETAAVAFSFLLDLIEGGILSQEFSYLTLDKSKVQRWRNQVMFQASEIAGNMTTDETIKGIFFDARKDNTLYNEKDTVTGRFHSKIKKESHVSVTSEPDGKYRFHFTPEEALAPYKPTYMEAKGIYEFLVSHGVDKTLEVVGGDSTNSNSGWKGGAIVWLEMMIG